jgi:Leucine-rich repeat (LRR) protein
VTRFTPVVLLLAVTVAVTAWPAAGQGTEQDEAVAAIRRMKGGVEFDPKRPGKPVTKVHLYAGKTAGIGLAPLAKLPEIEWIGLHLSDITEADLDHLKGLTKLRRLGLADIKLTDDGLRRIEGLATLEILFLMENPITDAGLDHLRRMTKLQELGLGQTKVTDAGLEKVAAFKEMQVLGLQQLKITTAGLGHLKPLTRLERLNLSGCVGVRDLQPLRGLPLTSLGVAYCPIKNLEPLAGMRLTSLDLYNCRQLADLTPLAGAPLTSLEMGGTQVADLTPLKGMKLTNLNCSYTPVADLSPLVGMPLTSLNLFGCPRLRDLAPLAGMPLTEVRLSPGNFTKDNLDVLRACKSLKTVVVGGKPADALKAPDFWAKVDRGEFKP